MDFPTKNDQVVYGLPKRALCQINLGEQKLPTLRMDFPTKNDQVAIEQIPVQTLRRGDNHHLSDLSSEALGEERRTLKRPKEVEKYLIEIVHFYIFEKIYQQTSRNCQIALEIDMFVDISEFYDALCLLYLCSESPSVWTVWTNECLRNA